MRFIIAVCLTAVSFSLAAPDQAGAQATCRQKCTDEEAACLKRTNNKGQCGQRAKICLAKCK